MNAGEVVQLFRSEVVEANRFFVVDTELYRYLNDGYCEFVRQSSGTPDVINLDVDVDEPEIDVPAYVMKVKKVCRLSDGRSLEIINYTDIGRGFVRDYGRTLQLPLNLEEKGDIRFFMIGAKKHTARLIAVPEVTDELELLVDRMPMNKITSPTSKFSDIDEVHQPALLDWLKAKVFRRPAKGLFNPQLAEFFENRFNTVVGEAQGAQNLFKTKVRNVQYGGV